MATQPYTNVPNTDLRYTLQCDREKCDPGIFFSQDGVTCESCSWNCTILRTWVSVLRKSCVNFNQQWSLLALHCTAHPHTPIWSLVDCSLQILQSTLLTILSIYVPCSLEPRGGRTSSWHDMVSIEPDIGWGKLTDTAAGNAQAHVLSVSQRRLTYADQARFAPLATCANCKASAT